MLTVNTSVALLFITNLYKQSMNDSSEASCSTQQCLESWMGATGKVSAVTTHWGISHHLFSILPDFKLPGSLQILLLELWQG